MSLELLEVNNIVREHAIREINPELVILFPRFTICIRLLATRKGKRFYEERCISFSAWETYSEEIFKHELTQMHDGFLLAFEKVGITL